ncbi:MAG: glutathione S-transferase [Pseudomonadota bacterium]
MSDYRLHCFAQSGNAYKVALYLNCAGLDWEPVFVDFMAGGVTRDPAWRTANNAMGEAPVLEHAGKSYSQSGAILTMLAEKTGKFAPNGADEAYEALRWILFDNHKFTSFLATYRFQRAFLPNAPDPAVLAFLKGRFEPALNVVEGHLANRAFILGDWPTIADFSFAGYAFFPEAETGFDFDDVAPNFAAWKRRMAALAGWQDPYDLMPGEKIAPVR